MSTKPATDEHPTYTYRRPRSKCDWAGISIGDAMNQDLDYYHRIPAQRKLERLTRAAQVAIHVEVAGQDPNHELITKAQLSPCRTTYPSTLAAYASVGLTAYLEYVALAHGEQPLSGTAELAMAHAPDAAGDGISIETRNRLIEEIASVVDKRLVLKELSGLPNSSAVEVYRLFAAAIKDLHAPRLRDILSTIVLYGDVTPDPLWNPEAWAHLHPATVTVAQAVASASTPFHAEVDHAPIETHPDLALRWTLALNDVLLPFMPSTQEPTQARSDSPKGAAPDPTKFRFRADAPAGEGQLIPPGRPQPPRLFDAQPPISMAPASNRDDPRIDTGARPSTELDEVLGDLGKSVRGALAPAHSWEDLASTQIQHLIASREFETGPIEGTVVTGHAIEVDLGERTESGEVLTRSVVPSEDVTKVETLRTEALPITRSLRRMLYPTTERVAKNERFRTVGSLDGTRLPLADICDPVFKRHCHFEQLDRRGRAVILIICDGSGSLGVAPTHMLKLLTTAWLDSTLGSAVQVLAGVYHTAAIGTGGPRPVIEWLVNPEMNLGHRDALRSVAALPDQGSGGQADALSIAYLIDEALRHARGARIYATLIGDLEWCRSFEGPQSAAEEVALTLRRYHERLAEQLHLTLIALGDTTVGQLEPVVKDLIRLDSEDLGDIPRAAARIATWVAGRVRGESRRLASVGR